MNPQTVLLALEKLNFKEKKILAPLKKCLKKLSFKSSADLWNLSHLAIWLYIYGYDAQALRVCQIIEDQEFKGDFNIWTPIEDLLRLEVRIYREHGKAKLAAKWKAKILEPLLPHAEAFKRRLSFNWLNDQGIARYVTANNLREANVIRFSDLGKLIFIRELGQGETDIDGQVVDIVRAEERIVEYKQILKQVK